MVFEVGETVVYPHHGAAKIEEIKMRTIKGEEKMYLKLRVAQGDLTIEVPAENVDLVGVRDVVGKEGLEHVFDVLGAEFTEEPTNWSRRYKANLEKLASGDVINPRVKAFVDGVTAAATGAIAGAAFVLGRRALTDVGAVLIALSTWFVFSRFKKLPEPLVIVAAGVVGLVLRRG